MKAYLKAMPLIKRGFKVYDEEQSLETSVASTSELKAPADDPKRQEAKRAQEVNTPKNGIFSLIQKSKALMFNKANKARSSSSAKYKLEDSNIENNNTKNLGPRKMQVLGNIKGFLTKKKLKPSNSTSEETSKTNKSILGKLVTYTISKAKKFKDTARDKLSKIGDKVGKTKFGKKLIALKETIKKNIPNSVTKFVRESLSVVRKSFSRGGYDRAKRKAREGRLWNSLEDLKFLARRYARVGEINASRNVQELIDRCLEEARLRREREERERLLREMRMKIASKLAESLMSKVFTSLLVDNFADLLRKIRWFNNLMRAWARMSLNIKRRERAKWSSLAIIDSAILKHRLFQLHKKRCEAAVIIQCAYRVLISHRVAFWNLLELQTKLCRMGKQHVVKKWKARLRYAILKITRHPTLLELWVKRRVKARQDYWQINVPPGKKKSACPTYDDFAEPYTGQVALKLPDKKPSKILSAIGNEEEQQKLKWVGIPVGVSSINTSPNHKKKKQKHWKLVYQPFPPSLLGVSLEDSRSRREADRVLENLTLQVSKQIADFAKCDESHHLEAGITEKDLSWYEKERESLRLESYLS